jgi:rubredoxin
MARTNECIKKTLELADLMLSLADEGDAVRQDVGCGVLYGVLRDSAYRIKKLAESERDAHIKKGNWENSAKEPGMQDYQCGICGYIYEPVNGDPEANIPPNTSFADLPDTWACPICGAGKEQFIPAS